MRWMVGFALAVARTKTVKLLLIVLVGLPLSLTVRVNIEVPVAPVAGLKTNDPLVFGLVYVMLVGVGINVVLLETTFTLKLCVFSFVGPAVTPLKFTVWLPGVTVNDKFGNGFNVGRSFVEVT